MNINTPYRTITREQFLFNEMRIVASLLSEGKSEKEIVEEIEKNEEIEGKQPKKRRRDETSLVY